ncbi:MAG: AbiV family abortive infection protein [Terriglobia bacterium]
MAKQSDWTKVVTPSIKNNMKDSAHTAYLNGCDLREDALSLFSIKRYARSAALAILSEEEFCKAFILFTCAGQGRWDSNIYKALRKHSEKQGISEGMRNHFDWFNETYRQFMAEHGSSFTQHQPPIIPSEKRVSELREKVRSRFSKPVRDFLKQDAFYVSLDEDGKVKSTPASISERDAQECLDESEKFKVITEVLLGKATDLTKWAPL